MCRAGLGSTGLHNIFSIKNIQVLQSLTFTKVVLFTIPCCKSRIKIGHLYFREYKFAPSGQIYA